MKYSTSWVMGKKGRGRRNFKNGVVKKKEPFRPSNGEKACDVNSTTPCIK